jgi:hypothetical protein
VTASQAKLAACGLASLLVAACGSSVINPAPSRPASASVSASASAPASASQTAGPTPAPLTSVYRDPLLNPQVAVAASGIYVAWQVSPLGEAVRSELARIDPASGRIEATLRLGAQFQQAIAVGRALWVATSAMAGDEVLRLTPGTLRVTGRWHVGTGAGQPYEAQVLAVAGGGLWADGGDRLVRFSLKADRAVESIVLPGAADSDLSANAAGTVLLVGEADRGGSGAVQRRDPRTGALLASHGMQGVAAPVVAGPIGSAVWISEATGMMGYVQRLDAATLAPAERACAEGDSTGTRLKGTNAIRAQLANGLLWITQPAGGDARNYCGRPSDGSAIAPIRLPRPADVVLAIGPHLIFYAAPGPSAGQYVRRAALPAPCRGAAG